MTIFPTPSDELQSAKDVADMERIRAEKAEARVKKLEESLHYCNGTANLAMKHRDDAEAKCDRLAAKMGEKDTALKWAEAVMSIVEPRSDKAEYMECLAAVRQTLASDGSAVADVITKLRIARVAPDYGREYAWDELWKAFDRLDGREADDAE